MGRPCSARLPSPRGSRPTGHKALQRKAPLRPSARCWCPAVPTPANTHASPPPAGVRGAGQGPHHARARAAGAPLCPHLLIHMLPHRPQVYVALDKGPITPERALLVPRCAHTC